MEKSLGKRSVAALCDYTIVAIFALLYMKYFGDSNEFGGYTVSGFNTLPIILFWFLYFPVTEYFTSGSLFKYVMGLKVVKLKKSPLSLKDTFLRHILDLFEVYAFFGLVGFIVIKSNKLPQRIGDLISKTVVVNKDDVELYSFGEERFEIIATLESEYKSLNSLPNNIYCNFCLSRLELDENEKHSKIILCPNCHSNLDYNEQV